MKTVVLGLLEKVFFARSGLESENASKQVLNMQLTYYTILLFVHHQKLVKHRKVFFVSIGESL